MGTILITLGIITLVAAVLTALETWFGWVRAMIRWLVINPIERPHLSAPRIIESYHSGNTFKKIGIEMQNMPYEGWLKSWVNRKAEEVVTVDYEVIDPFGEVVMRGDGRWEHGAGTRIPPTGGRESGIRQMYLFNKTDGVEIASAQWMAREGGYELPPGGYTLNGVWRNTANVPAEFRFGLYVTEDLEGFGLEDVIPHTE